jgi:hypothetical protein
MMKQDAGKQWTIVHEELGEPTVRRYQVPRGWLYQVEEYPFPRSEGDYWHPPVFVPGPIEISHKE